MKKRAIQLLMLALAVISVGSLLSPVSAPAAPIDDKQAEAAQLEQQITDNGRRMDALNEQINSAQIALDEANVTITTANAQVAAATAKAHDLRAALAERAVSVYRQSGSEDGVANLDVKNTSDLATRRKYTDLAAQREKQLVNQLAHAKEELAARKADAEAARAVAEKTQAQIQATKSDLAAGDSKQRALLSQVKGDIAVLVAQQEAQRRAAEEAATQARLASAATAAPKATAGTNNGSGGGNNGGGGNSGGGGSTPSVNPPAVSGGAGAALAYAYAQLGKPYCYAGVGPECYDCSGLVMMAWAQAGINTPHGSTEQYNMFPHVPLSQAQPGDIIAWDGHDGLYIGGGMMIHAPHTGTVVQIAPVYGTPWGAARPG
jgi:cell wall-associated NlpC family hydrolase